MESRAYGINWETRGKVNSKINSNHNNNYSFRDNTKGRDLLYRLGQTDNNGTVKYFKSVCIKNCREEKTEALVLFPNPSSGKFDLFYEGDKGLIKSVEVFDRFGDRVYFSDKDLLNIELSNQSTGLYFVNLNLNSKIITKKLFLEK